MEGLEIKFWDEDRKVYEEDSSEYFVGFGGEVFVCNGADYYGDRTIEECSTLEAHIYVNGERVA